MQCNEGWNHALVESCELDYVRGRNMSTEYAINGLVQATRNLNARLRDLATREVKIFPRSLDFDNDVSGTFLLYGRSIKTGLLPDNSQAPIFLEASLAAWKNDADHNYNVGLFVNNWTKDGAGIVVGNRAGGDGIFVQTEDTDATNTAYAINVFAGRSAGGTLDVGTGISVQRFGLGYALQLIGVAGGLAPLVNLSQEVNFPTITALDSGTTTADTLTFTTTAKTSGKIFQLYHGVSVFAGEGMVFNFGNSGGSFTGKFFSLQVAGVEKFALAHDGATNDALVVVSSAKTTGRLFNAFHGTSVFTGNVLEANVGNSGGSFTGKFFSLLMAGVEKLALAHDGAANDTLVLTTTAKTTGRLVNLFHGVSTLTGELIVANVGNSGGAFTGKYFSLQKAGVVVFEIADDGATNYTVLYQSVSKTTGGILSLYHETSVFSGDALLMNLGNGAGSFTGVFAKFQKAGVTMFQVSHDGIAYVDGNIGLGGTSFGGGSKVMFIANAGTVPSANPTGGGVIYTEGGALKFRGSAGTVTTLAVA